MGHRAIAGMAIQGESWTFFSRPTSVSKRDGLAIVEGSTKYGTFSPLFSKGKFCPFADEDDDDDATTGPLAKASVSSHVRSHRLNSARGGSNYLLV